VKNVICAWVTIGLMGLGTAAAATHAARVERAASEWGRTARVKRPRQARPPATTPDVEIRESTPAVKPAPPSRVDTRQLSRVSRRQA
jgi:hypothetical protein